MIDEADLPEPWGVLYAAPNKNGERKSCGNCRFAKNGATKCEILPSPISREMVCGYHVPAGELANPKLSGLTTVPGGTSCDTCRFYEGDDDENGTCHGVVDTSGEYAAVEAKGCCARWEESETEDDT